MVGDGSSTYMTLDTVYATTWKDQSGNGNNLINASGTDIPEYQSANECIYFDASDDYYTLNVADFNHPVTVYIVVNIAARVAGRTVFQLGGPGSTRGRIYHGSSGSQTVLESGTLSLTRDATYGSYHLFTCVMNQDTVNGTIFQVDNNAEVVGTSSSGNTVTEFRIGTEYSLSQQSVKEWIIRANADDETSRTEVKDYLNTKYSLWV
jgi:hypothetical protein